MKSFWDIAIWVVLLVSNFIHVYITVRDVMRCGMKFRVWSAFRRKIFCW
jgi:hypothetical protein